MKYVAKFNAQASFNLPATMCREIGRIMVRWSYLEQHLQRSVYDLLGLTADVGRLAVVERRAPERLDLIRDLAARSDIELDEHQRKDLRKRIEDTKRVRDLMAHGLWHLFDDVWHVQDTRGTWSDTPHPEVKGITRKDLPQGRPFDVAALRAIVAEIDQMISEARQLRSNLMEQIEELSKEPQQP
jgi:hypothetical protein